MGYNIKLRLYHHPPKRNYPPPHLRKKNRFLQIYIFILKLKIKVEGRPHSHPIPSLTYPYRPLGTLEEGEVEFDIFILDFQRKSF